MSDEINQADEQAFDALLAETLGGLNPPDLSGIVLDRLESDSQVRIDDFVIETLADAPLKATHPKTLERIDNVRCRGGNSAVADGGHQLLTPMEIRRLRLLQIRVLLLVTKLWLRWRRTMSLGTYRTRSLLSRSGVYPYWWMMIRQASDPSRMVLQLTSFNRLVIYQD